MNSPRPNVPEAMRPIWETLHPNAPIELYDGPIVFRQRDSQTNGTARISMRWHPTCKIQFESVVVDARPLCFPTLAGGEMTLLELRGKPVVQVYIESIKNAMRGNNFSGRVRAITLGNGTRLSRLAFHLPNFPIVRDTPIQNSSNRSTWCGRHVLEGGGWKITADRTIARELWNQTIKTAGTSLTHVGSIERVDGAAFNTDDVADVLDCLFFFYSFCKSHWTGPLLLAGYDSDGTKTYDHMEAIRVTPERSRRVWLDTVETDSLMSLFPGFWKRWTDPNWQSTIRTCVYFFVDAHLPGRSAEGGIMQYWSIIEALGWQEFVVSGKLTAGEFYGKRGKEKVALILDKYGIDKQLPAEIGALPGVLAALSPPKIISNGAEALAAIRNAYAHPMPANIRIIDATDQFTLVVFELAAKYAALCMLKAMEFEGKYMNHLKSGDFHWDISEFVPWSSKKKTAVR